MLGCTHIKGKQGISRDMSGYADPPVATRFQPGQSGNPQGRPVGRRSLATIIRDLLEENIDFSKMDSAEVAALAEAYGARTAWEGITLVAVKKALQGDMQAAKWLSVSAYGNRQVIEAEAPLAPLTPAMQQAVLHQLEVQQAGQRALESEATT